MENLGKTLTFHGYGIEFFFKTKRRDRKAFRLITSSVRQFDINIHFLKASVPWLVCQVMNMVKTSRQGFLFGTIIYHHFCIWRKFGRFALQFGVLDTHARATLFLKSEWQMTNDAVILYQNAMKIEMPTEVHFHKRQV